MKKCIADGNSKTSNIVKLLFLKIETALKYFFIKR